MSFFVYIFKMSQKIHTLDYYKVSVINIHQHPAHFQNVKDSIEMNTFFVNFIISFDICVSSTCQLAMVLYHKFCLLCFSIKNSLVDNFSLSKAIGPVGIKTQFQMISVG